MKDLSAVDLGAIVVREASGARVLTTLVYAMRERQARYGVASLCIGGGMGTATVVERM